MRQDRENADCGERAERISELNQRTEKPAVLALRVFDHDQHGAAPFSAESHALKQPQQNEEDRRCDADLPISGNEADEEGAEAHDDNGRREHRLTTDPIAEMSKDCGAEGSREIADAKGAERCDGA